MSISFLSKLLPSLPSLDGLIVGHSTAVGMRYVPPTASCPPLRIYYPALLDDINQDAPWYYWFGHSPLTADMYLTGLLLVLTQSDGSNRWNMRLCRIFARLLSWVLPLRYRSLPAVHVNARLDTTTTKQQQQQQQPLLPVILFSHGLTGTGIENALLCAAWARKCGAIVVAVHHQDGSSACVPTHHHNEGCWKWYERGPALDANYDATFRPRQVLTRVQELRRAVEFLAQDDKWAPHIDLDNKLVLAGFSYGAATVALAAAKDDFPPTRGLIFLDGWFYIDVAESAGIEFEFPRLAFEQRHILHQKPTCFINSSEFASYPKLWKATQRLASSPPIVLPDTRHNNFCEIWCWMPTFLLKWLGAIGKESNPKQVYREIIDQTTAFLQTTFA